LEKMLKKRAYIFYQAGFKTMKTLFSLFAVLVTATVVLNGFAGTATKADSFMLKAAQSDMLKIMSSRVALQTSSNEEVRFFAQMINDQTRMSDELKTIAANKNVSLPTTVSSKQQLMLDMLNRSTAETEFNREYMRMQIKIYEDDVKLFQKQANDIDTEDADAKAFADKRLPLLQSHLTSAQKIYSRVRGNTGGSTNSDSNKDNK
jgi:putative membrane protein